MTYEEVMKQARFEVGPYCKVCPVCNGRACKNQIPGPGAKGIGDVAIRNYDQWQQIRVNMDTIGENVEPVGAMRLHYGDKYDDEEYNQILVSACAKYGIAAFTGDGTDPNVFQAAARAIKDNDGRGIPTIKPWNMETIHEKLDLVFESGAMMAAMDIDAAGLPFLKNMEPPAGNKTVEDLSLIVHEAGASAIVVSTHGGRVLDQPPATAEVLEEIVEWNEGRMKIFVDGGIRTGIDVFKALAMGADAVLIARPFVQAVYGGQEEGVRLYIEKLAAELKDTMAMCGATDIQSISRKMIRR